jgi:hypothetical protein
MTTPRISLNQQLEAVGFAAARQATLAQGGTVKGLRPRSVEEYDLQRLQAVNRTLLWLVEHEAEIKAFLALPSDARAGALAMAGEIARREAIAAAGGPVR